MIDIIRKLGVILEECERIKADLLQKISKATDDENKNTQHAIELSRKELSLNQREKDLEKIEDLIQYRKDADLKVQQAQGTIDDFHKRVTNFATYESAKAKELADREMLLGRREDALNKKEANLENLVLEKVRSVLKK